MGLCLSVKILIKFLEHNGYRFIRSNGGSHHIYGNGKVNIPIPVHGNSEIGEILIRQILKEIGSSKQELYKWLGR